MPARLLVRAHCTAIRGRNRTSMNVDDDALQQLLSTLDRFVRERLIPNEHCAWAWPNG